VVVTWREINGPEDARGLRQARRVKDMLRAVLKNSLQRILRRPPGDAESQAIFPVEESKALNRLHESAPIDLHTQILFGDAKIGTAGALELFKDCVSKSHTAVSPGKAFIRIQNAINLANYFLYSLTLDGARAECGVFQGFSALFVCRAAALKLGAFSGADFHLIDSFMGFPKMHAEDFIPVKVGPNKTGSSTAYGEGDAAAPIEYAQRVMRDYPDIRFHRGYIPQVFSELSETNWAYVHLDVDLYEATLAGMQYFYPRMVKGGVMICDDYGAKLFPGAHKAWDGYCKEHNIPYVVLATGQSVLFKQ
jgi:O-methyltransferase